MNENIKSVGTSTSSLTPNSSTSSPTRKLSSASRIDRSKAMSRPVEFFTSHTSDSIVKTNGSIVSIDPPPYSIDPSIDPPPYPIDELPHGKNLLPYPLGPVGPDFDLSFPVNNFPSVNPLQEFAGPSAPTICELDHKIGLTPTEREEIIKTTLRMKQTVGGKTELERTDFLGAQKKLKELFLSAQEKWTEEEKNEFISEAKKIIETYKQKEMEKREEERNERLRKEAERRARQIKEEEEEANDCYCDLWSIFFKGLQLGMVIMTYAESKKNKNDDSTAAHLLSLLCFVTTIFTSCLFIFYAFGRRPARSMLQAELLYCGFCIFSFATMSSCQFWRSFHGKLFGYGAAFGYTLDFLHTYCLLKKPQNFSNSETTMISELRNNNIKNSSTDYSKNDFLMAENVAVGINNPQNSNISNETILNLDFLDVNYEEKYPPYQHHSHNNSHNNGHNFSSHDNVGGDHNVNEYFPITSDHHNDSNHHTNINNHHINSNDYGATSNSDFVGTSDYDGGYSIGGSYD